MSVSIDISAPCPWWKKLDFDAAETAQSIIPLALEQADLPPSARGRDHEISLTLTDDETVHILNREYRGKDKPTNVLSFASMDADEPAGGGPLLLGDIVMAYETIATEARAMNISFKNHYTHLLVHGTLHLLGYDHERDDQARIMENLETHILAALGIENPYADRESVPQ